MPILLIELHNIYACSTKHGVLWILSIGYGILCTISLILHKTLSWKYRWIGLFFITPNNIKIVIIIIIIIYIIIIISTYLICNKYVNSLSKNKTEITKTIKTNVIVFHNNVYHKNVFSFHPQFNNNIHLFHFLRSNCFPAKISTCIFL